MEREEAIEIARNLYNKSLFLKKDKEAMATLIPELKESEDENQLCKQIKEKINSIGVKEVDWEHLEQEVKDFCYEYDDRKEKWYELCPNDRKLLYNPTWANFAMSIAKYFFERGLKAQKGE